MVVLINAINKWIINYIFINYNICEKKVRELWEKLEMWEKARCVRKSEKSVRKVICVRKKWEMWEREVWANVSMRKKCNKLLSYKDADLFKNFD